MRWTKSSSAWAAWIAIHSAASGESASRTLLRSASMNICASASSASRPLKSSKHSVTRRKINPLIEFTKAHACGNDFLIVINESAAGFDKAELAQRLCDRNTGIGADGVEFFEWTGDFSGRIRLHNADGSVAEISGNGTRCVAAWMADELDSQPGDELSIETDAGVRVCTIQEFRDSDNGGPTTLITADMDVPEFEEKTVELSDGSRIEGVFVSMGNPHFVIWMDTSDRDDYRREHPDESAETAAAEMDFSLGQLSW